MKRLLWRIAACCVAAVLAAVPAVAWAEDAAPATVVAAPDTVSLTSPENVVNTQQMPDNSFLYDTSIYDLVNADSTYDNKTVQVTGEVVGDAIAAGLEHNEVWITLASADPSKEGSISVLMNADQVALIDTFGGYNRTGTTLQVQGTFHLACSTHEGTMDIHATKVSATAAGRTTPDEFDWHDFIPGAVLVGAALLLTLLYHLLAERQR